MERHYGQYSMCRARSMSVVYSRCGSLIIDVDHRCRPSIVDVDRRSSMSKIDVDVDHRCWLSKINIDVDHRCRSSIVDADRRSSMSKIDVDVDHPCLLSKINIDVDHRCDCWSTLSITFLASDYTSTIPAAVITASVRRSRCTRLFTTSQPRWWGKGSEEINGLLKFTTRTSHRSRGRTNWRGRQRWSDDRRRFSTMAGDQQRWSMAVYDRPQLSTSTVMQ